MFNYNNLRLLLIWSGSLLFSLQTMAYNSSYDLIQWEPRGEDKEYCIDITDHEFNIYPGFQAIACGQDMYEFSPRHYVENVLKTSVSNGLTFYWRVWSPNGYGGNGFEGKVTVGADCGLPYRSDSEKLQWGCRFQDTNYCIDIFDKDWKEVKRPFVCGENMHSFDPQRLNELNLPSGKYHWKVWSAHAYEYDNFQGFFEGEFNFLTANNSENLESPCVNIAGNWNVSETLTMTQCVLGNCESQTATGKDVINIQQNGCNISSELTLPNNTTMSRTGTVNGNNVHMTGKFFVNMSYSCSITKNVININGTVNNNQMNLQSLGIAEGSCDGISFSVTGKSTIHATK